MKSFTKCNGKRREDEKIQRINKNHFFILKIISYIYRFIYHRPCTRWKEGVESRVRYIVWGVCCMYIIVCGWKLSSVCSVIREPTSFPYFFFFPLLLLLPLIPPDVLNTKIKKQLNENVKYMFSIFPNYLPNN